MAECKSIYENNKAATICVGVTGFVLLCKIITNKSSNKEEHHAEENSKNKKADEKDFRNQVFIEE